MVYMAPEVIKMMGNDKEDYEYRTLAQQKADMFSLGVTLFEICNRKEAYS